MFFLKQVISALMTVANLLYFSSIHPFCLLAFSTNPLCRINALKEAKILSALYFLFILLRVLNVIVFDYNGLKQSLILQTNKTVCYHLLSCTVFGETGVSVWHYISHNC